MPGFWSRLETRLAALQRDRGRMARWVLVAYWISTAFAVLGFVLAFLILVGRWPF